MIKTIRYDKSISKFVNEIPWEPKLSLKWILKRFNRLYLGHKWYLCKFELNNIRTHDSMIKLRYFKKTYDGLFCDICENGSILVPKRPDANVLRDMDIKTKTRNLEKFVMKETSMVDNGYFCHMICNESLAWRILTT